LQDLARARGDDALGGRPVLSLGKGASFFSFLFPPQPIESEPKGIIESWNFIPIGSENQQLRIRSSLRRIGEIDWPCDNKSEPKFQRIESTATLRLNPPALVNLRSAM
jgi:hypothetical protein